MHLRYDLKHKLDLVNFEKQSSFFLKKEDCVFSFYLSDFAISFNIVKSESGDFKSEICISEPIKEYKNGDLVYNSIAPQLDPRFNGLELFKEMFDQGSFQGCFVKKSPQETIDNVIYIVKLMYKINKLATLA